MNANLYDRYHLDEPGALAASKRRAELREALAVLESQPIQLDFSGLAARAAPAGRPKKSGEK